MQWMDSVQNAAVDENKDNNSQDDKQDEHVPPLPTIQKPERSNFNSNSLFEEDLKYPHLKYSKEANYKESAGRNDDTEWHQKSHERAKRATRPKEENKNTCSLYIQTDPLIWRHIREGIADVSGNQHCDNI